MDNKDTASPPGYYAATVAPQAQAEAPPPPAAPTPAPVVVQTMQIPQMTEAQLGYNYQLELMARCARGEHQVSTKYGVVGIICSVALFPVGMLCLLYVVPVLGLAETSCGG
ncbi:uncharacterized protein B0H18DRAFT_972862 [Fomitopsis serialis]|uniref:uncharacterized protein n=1 Tax=Fomitopsis serialis TaxID=139415 RepID=UPI0020071E1A|nr:uncharacterized protein B0H18DRAFT_972862 [Neoantrodia serialis]KAH9936218.1 hypothetical protein B0H18DRAFT_972862 [Neoantrodia serialis]